MKQIIKMIDNTTSVPSVKVKEIVLRDYDHFQSQLKYHSHIFKNHKTYTRKQKHRSYDEYF